MDFDVMKSYLSHLSGFLKIDFYLYEKDEQKDSFVFVGDPFELRGFFVRELADKSLFAMNTEVELAFAKIPIENTPYTLFVGPCLTVPKNNYTTMKILNYFSLPQSIYGELDDSLSTLPTFQFSSFVALALSVYEAINNAVPDIGKIFSPDFSKNEAVRRNPALSENKTLSTTLREQSYKFETKLAFMIEKGLVEEIRDLGNYHNLMTTAAQIAFDTMRQMKNLVEVFVTICSRAAMRGGLPPIIAYDLSDVFFYRTENSTSIEELFNVSTNIPTVFATKVREFSSYKTNNLVVRKAIRYAYDNLTSKMSLSSVSEAIGVSPTYLSSQFSKELNKSFPSMIKNARVAYSEYLLRFTDRSLAEIADLLCFSSQSAFQNAFKEIVGMTPTEYKTQNII